MYLVEYSSDFDNLSTEQRQKLKDMIPIIWNECGLTEEDYIHWREGTYTAEHLLGPAYYGDKVYTDYYEIGKKYHQDIFE